MTPEAWGIDKRPWGYAPKQQWLLVMLLFRVRFRCKVDRIRSQLPWAAHRDCRGSRRSNWESCILGGADDGVVGGAVGVRKGGEEAVIYFFLVASEVACCKLSLVFNKILVQANSQKSDEREEENILLLLWRKKRCKQRARDIRAPGVGDGEVVGSWQRHYNEVEDEI